MTHKELHISYAARPDATSEGEINALAACYRIVLDSRKENAAGVTSTNGDDEKGSQNVSRHTQYTR